MIRIMMVPYIGIMGEQARMGSRRRGLQQFGRERERERRGERVERGKGERGPWFCETTQHNLIRTTAAGGRNYDAM